MALFHTLHMYLEPSSSLVGLTTSVALDGVSLSLAGSSTASRALKLPSMYQLICGGGEPPTEAHVRL